uniref:Shiftless antiviral inhibitor of ribosomal frameshifting protein homolog n=1 Tax=Petromyzon marinus TaxID=7757 RepID=A0AAJ7XJC0_PETMA
SGCGSFVVFAVQVSQCRSCNRKYQPVPRDREWGSGALFNCTTCDNTFRLTAIKGTACMCRLGTDGRAHIAVLAVLGGVWRTRVQRPDTHSAARPSGQQLSCMAEDCYNPQGASHVLCARAHPARDEARHVLCARAHPARDEARHVLHASEPHVSSASTVATCISQGSLVEHEDVLIEQDLLEEDENRRH